MNSIKDIYKIGHGPSSSHTMGPAKASKIFKDRYPNADLIKVELFGSLALTGKGHLTDKAIIDEFYPTKVEVKFNYDILYEYHSNAMKFYAYKDNTQIGEWLVFSIGGGELRELNENLTAPSKQVYPTAYMEDVLKELRVASVCGLVLAIANIVRMYLFCEGTFEVFLVVSLAMFCAIVVAKLIGCSLPIFAKIVKLDPALMAGPMIATLVDIVTLVIYFGLAKVFLL